MKKRYPIALTIAGSDSGGGAGIQADIKAISATGAYAASVITALTAQNTRGVKAIMPVPAKMISQQIDAVLKDIGADAIKIGMLHTKEAMLAVCRALDKYHFQNTVLDPVMVSTSGHTLIQEDAIETLKKELLPRVRIITPNIPEAEYLLGYDISTIDKLKEAAQELAMTYSTSILAKGGHLSDKILCDSLYNMEEANRRNFIHPHIRTKNTHGTGCTLSSAIASFLAQGLSLPVAVENAEKYIFNAISRGKDYIIGHGHGPVCHF